MPELNGEIDALDNKVAGDVQLSLYAAVQDLLLDRIVWFLRQVDLSQGLETVIAHYRDGIEQVRGRARRRAAEAGARGLRGAASPS